MIVFSPPFSGCVLFFGCRNSKKDFFFKEEWQQLVENGKLQLFAAFSRDQVRNKGKTNSITIQYYNLCRINAMLNGSVVAKT